MHRRLRRRPPPRCDKATAPRSDIGQGHRSGRRRSPWSAFLPSWAPNQSRASQPRTCRCSIAFLCSSVLIPECDVAVVIPFESQPAPSIDRLVDLVAADMDRVNATILSRTGSDGTMIPEGANHLINSGGKRLRPMLTLAMARLAGYAADGHVKLAAAVEFMHTATLLHDDVVDESEMRRGRLAARMLWGNEASV